MPERFDPYAHAPRLPDDDPLDLGAVVGRAAGPLELEIGPGRGGFILERLAADPDVRLVGLEVRRKWATIVDDRLARLGHGPRARVFAADARATLPRLRPGSVQNVFIHFPDPWWKKRHHKRLLLTSAVAREIARILVPGGQLFVQTDVEERAAAYRGVLDAEIELQPVGETPCVEDNPFEARSPREHRALSDGLPVVRLLYRRRLLPGPGEG